MLAFMTLQNFRTGGIPGCVATSMEEEFEFQFKIVIFFIMYAFML